MASNMITSDELNQFIRLSFEKKVDSMELYLMGENGYRYNMQEIGARVFGDENYSYTVSLIHRCYNFAGKNSEKYKNGCKFEQTFGYRVTRKDIEEFVNKYPNGTFNQGITFEDFLKTRVNSAKSAQLKPQKQTIPRQTQRVVQQPQKLNQLQRLPKSHVNTTADTTGDASKKNKVIIGGICTVALIIVTIFLFRSVIGGGNPLNSKNVLNEIQHFIPTQLSGLTIGEMFDGTCTNGVWSSYEVDNNNGLFSTASTWARFSGNSERGEINATFTITKERMLDYTCFVDGKPIALEELYRMFHDPNYDKDLRATAEAAENEAKFDATEEKINKMNLVHNYVVDDFKGMTILKFTDSVCTSGEWSSNEKTGNLRVVFEGQSEKGKLQAIFDVDEKLGTVKGSWYFNSREIAATDLYQKFYP